MALATCWYVMCSGKREDLTKIHGHHGLKSHKPQADCVSLRLECYTGVGQSPLIGAKLSNQENFNHIGTPNLLCRCKNSLMDLSLIPAQPKPGLINVLIEIPAGSKNKYEFDKDIQAFALDRVLYSSVQYPYDYGFVPNTLADDGDPLDGMVLMDQPTFPGCVIAARPIGMLEMIDGGDRDEKILCVPAKDPRYADVKSLGDIAQHRLDEISEFFKTYKNLEKKITEILGWQDVDKVMPLVETCIKAGSEKG